MAKTVANEVKPKSDKVHSGRIRKVKTIVAAERKEIKIEAKSSSGHGDKKNTEVQDNDGTEKKIWKIEDFNTIEKIGDGGFGQVYKSSSVHEGVFRALKYINIDDMEEMNIPLDFITRESFLQESASHINIVSCFGNFSDGQNRILILDFCELGNLHTFNLKSLDETYIVRSIRAKSYVRQIVSAVSYMHSTLGVIHMDIKPRNILLCTLEHVKVTDFGCAVDTDSTLRQIHDYREDYRGGTPSYFPPELLRHENFNSTVDTWGIALVAYELLTRERPFFPFHEMDNDVGDESSRIDENGNLILNARINKALENMELTMNGELTMDSYDEIANDTKVVNFFRQTFLPIDARPLVRDLEQLPWLSEADV